MPQRLRLIDLQTAWLLQYANETTLFAPELYAHVKHRIGQVEGYLGATRAAVISCVRSHADWQRVSDPWKGLTELIARVEAEFSGRLLIGPEDHARWLADVDGLTWGVLGVGGLDAQVRGTGDLERVRKLFERGVRLFQPVSGPATLLAGGSADTDERGLTDLGRAFLDLLFEVAAAARGPRPLLDFAGMNPRSMSDVLTWFESNPSRAERVVPLCSHGAVWDDRSTSPVIITPANLRRLRALGGVMAFSVGPPFHRDSDSLKRGIETTASLPFRGREGFDGIAIGTSFLSLDRTLPGLGNAADVVSWLESNFNAEDAALLVQGNAAALFARMSGSDGTS